MAKIPLHEIRKLSVPLETAVDAALDLDAEQGGTLGFGPIVEAHVETDPQPGLSVVVQRRGTDVTERRVFSLPVLAAALIRYCWKSRIPLPRQGTKRIEAGPDGFVFTIEGTIEVVRRHSPLPGQSASRRIDVAPAAVRDADPTNTEQSTQIEQAQPQEEALEALAG